MEGFSETFSEVLSQIITKPLHILQDFPTDDIANIVGIQMNNFSELIQHNITNSYSAIISVIETRWDYIILSSYIMLIYTMFYILINEIFTDKVNNKAKTIANNRVYQGKTIIDKDKPDNSDVVHITPKPINIVEHSKIMRLNNKDKTINGLYFESLKEVLEKDQDDSIMKAINDGRSYAILLRVRMENYITIPKTNYDLHGNNVAHTDNGTIFTKDMYMIFTFKFLGKEEQKGIKTVEIISFFMNYINFYIRREFKTSDFIVIAIGSQSPNDNPKEFYNGLININYEMDNLMNIRFIAKDKEINAGSVGNAYQYQLMLPIHNIYDLFMDVYNNNIFESKKYEIDDDNFESWDKASINDIEF